MADTEGVDQEYRRYVAEIDLYEREYKSWETRAKKVVKLFKDADNDRGQKKRFNVLWSNVETLKPALYARDPQPVAERRFRDADPVGRAASDVIERCLSYTIDCQDYGHVARQCVSDRLLPGRGVAWYRYEPTIDGDEIQYEKAIPDYVNWMDFGHQIARTWDEVGIVWRRVYMSRAKLIERFGDIGKTIPLDHTPKGLKDEKVGEDIKKAAIYELWDKDKRLVSFLSRSHPKLIESKAPELKLTTFWPTQRPLYATLTTDSLVPTPDYALYQTQAQELEELTARIDAVQKDLRVAGVYDASAAGLSELIGGGYKNKLIPVTNWAQFSEKGGLDGAIDFLPLEEIANALIAMYEAREKSKQDLYEITGIADIIRGNTEPSETATAQQIKGRFAVLRISDSQADVQRWVRDGMRIMGEIIAENFSLETIKAISGVKLPTQAEKQAFEAQQQLAQKTAQETGQQPPEVPDEIAQLMRQPTWEEVHALMSNQVLREFRIDIETDSTIRTDEDAEKAERTEFLTAAGAYMEKAAIVGQQVPELQPLLLEMLMFGVRAHRSARRLEPAFEDAMRELEKPKPPQPDPELQKVMAKGQVDKELEGIKAQTTIAVAEKEQQFQAQENLMTAKIEDQRAQRDGERELVIEREKMQMQKEIEMFKAKLQAEVDMHTASVQGEQQKQDQDYQERATKQKNDRSDYEFNRDYAVEQDKRAREDEVFKRNEESKAKDRDYEEKRSKDKGSQRDGQIAAAQKLVEALAQLKGAKVH